MKLQDDGGAATKLSCALTALRAKERFLANPSLPYYLRDKDYAKRALVEATKKPSVEWFRQTIGGCCDPRSPIDFAALKLEPPTERSSIREALRSSRKNIAVANDETLYGRYDNIQCRKHKAMQKAFKACPCHKAFYCDKNYYKAAWKEHKRKCEWYMAKMKGTKKAGNKKGSI